MSSAKCFSSGERNGEVENGLNTGIVWELQPRFEV